jgi:hypothetical protein
MAGAYEKDLPSKEYDLGDAIFRAYDGKAHFLATLARRKKMKEIYSMWTVDAQGNSYETAVAEGTDHAGTPVSQQPKAVYARAQIFRSNRWQVTRTAQAVDQSDTPDEVVKQKGRCQENFMISIEKALLSFQEAVATGTRKTRGLMQWALDTEQAVDPVNEALRPTSTMRHTTGLSALTQTVFENMIGAARTQLRQRPVLVGKVGQALKRHMTNWGKVIDLGSAEAALQRYNINGAEKKLYSMIDFFEFDTGAVRTMITDYLACDPTTWLETDYTPRSGIFYMPERVFLRWLRPIEHFDQDDDGGGRRGYYEGEGMLGVDSPQGFITVYTNLDTAA